MAEFTKSDLATDNNERFERKLNQEPAFASKISPDSSMVAVSFGNG